MAEIVRNEILGGSYYDLSSFQNTIFSTILCMQQYWADFLFDGTLDRVVYAKNDFAFRRRIETQKLDPDTVLQATNLNFPFMNFSITGIQPDTDRRWKNFGLELDGIFNETIGKKIRMSPVKIQFEASYFTNKTNDLHYIMSELMWDDALETIVRPQLEIDGELFDNHGQLLYNGMDFDSQYNENDWLEKNKINVIGMDFEIDTFLVKANTERFGIPKEVIFSFGHSQGLEGTPDQVIQGVIDHLEEVVVF